MGSVFWVASFISSLLVLACLSAPSGLDDPHITPIVFVDQDGTTQAGTTDNTGLIPLLVAHGAGLVKIVGISTETGDGWQVQGALHFLRLQEEILGASSSQPPLHLGLENSVTATQDGLRRWKDENVPDLKWLGAYDPRVRKVETMKDIRREDFPEGLPSHLSWTNTTAKDALIAAAQQLPGQVTYVALGTLGNLQEAVEDCPELPLLLKQVVWMGGNMGSYSCSNFHCESEIVRKLEFNVFFDPLPVKQLLGESSYNKFSRFQLVTGDACVVALYEPWMRAYIEAARDKTASARYIYDFVNDFEGSLPMWDQLAGVVSLDMVTRSNMLKLATEEVGFHVNAAIDDASYGTNEVRRHRGGSDQQVVQLVTSYDVRAFQCLYLRLATLTSDDVEKSVDRSLLLSDWSSLPSECEEGEMWTLDW